MISLTAESSVKNNLQPENIPKDLIENSMRWLGYKLTWNPDNGRYQKEPHTRRGNNVFGCSWTNVKNYTTFKNVLQTYNAGLFEGIGYRVDDTRPFTFIDLDRAIDENGKLLRWAKVIVDQFNSYVEYSVSGTGLHIIIKGKPKGKPNWKCPTNKDIQIYSNYWLTITGNVYGEKKPINNCQTELDEFIGQYPTKDNDGKQPKVKPKREPAQKLAPGPIPALTEQDERLIERAKANRKHGEKFANAFDGLIVDFPGKSYSEMEWWLLERILYYVSGDGERTERIFLNSPAGQNCEKRKKGGCRRYVDHQIKNLLKRFNENSYIHRILERIDLFVLFSYIPPLTLSSICNEFFINADEKHFQPGKDEFQLTARLQKEHPIKLVNPFKGKGSRALTRLVEHAFWKSIVWGKEFTLTVNMGLAEAIGEDSLMGPKRKLDRLVELNYLQITCADYQFGKPGKGKSRLFSFIGTDLVQPA